MVQCLWCGISLKDCIGPCDVSVGCTDPIHVVLCRRSCHWLTDSACPCVLELLPSLDQQSDVVNSPTGEVTCNFSVICDLLPFPRFTAITLVRSVAKTYLNFFYEWQSLFSFVRRFLSAVKRLMEHFETMCTSWVLLWLLLANVAVQ